MNFVRNENADMNGSHLVGYTDGINDAIMARTFGAPDRNAYIDDEAGYEGMEYTFVAEKTGEPVKLYSRYGNYRVGGYSEEIVAPFIEWLDAQKSGADTIGEIRASKAKRIEVADF